MISQWDDSLSYESRFVNKRGEVIYRIQLLNGLWGSPGGAKYISREAAKAAYEWKREKEIQYARDMEKFSQEKQIREAEADRQAARTDAEDVTRERNTLLSLLIVSWLLFAAHCAAVHL